jgi:NAD+ kinase
MRILLFSRMVKNEDTGHISRLIDLLNQKNVEYSSTDEIHKVFNGKSNYHPINVTKDHESLRKNQIDYIISLGGDGTILEATGLIRHLEIPILGINLGRLGFLAGVEKKNLEDAIEHLIRGNYTIDSRTMLYLESNLPLFDNQMFALNDFTLHKRDTSSMITITAYINGDQLNAYWSDGIIVATPTGSTAYSLSCGGPIIFPGSGNFVLTPVAPHHLNVRPIVISDNSIISFEIEGRSENFLCTLDSRFETITTNHQLAVRKCDFETKLIQIHDQTFLNTLRNKLSWGSDNRN